VAVARAVERTPCFREKTAFLLIFGFFMYAAAYQGYCKFRMEAQKFGKEVCLFTGKDGDRLGRESCPEKARVVGKGRGEEKHPVESEIPGAFQRVGAQALDKFTQFEEGGSLFVF
jgi:hypothetical protein